MTKEEESISAGRAIVSSVFASYATTVILLLAFRTSSLKTLIDVVTFSIQTSLTVYLFYSIWTGRNWARWTFSVLCVFAFLFILWVGISDFSWRIMLIAVYFASLPVSLCVPASVDAFLIEQKRKRIRVSQALLPTHTAVTYRAGHESSQP